MDTNPANIPGRTVSVKGSHIPAFLMGRPRELLIARLGGRPNAAVGAAERSELTLAA